MVHFHEPFRIAILARLLTITEDIEPCDQFFDVEKNRGRTTCRIVEVFTKLKNIDRDWVGVQSLIRVKRIGIRSGKKYLQTNHYISSLVSTATNFANRIRQHWGIENRLHWVKDVIFGEDAAPFRNYNAATNWSIIRNIAINLAPMRWL